MKKPKKISQGLVQLCTLLGIILLAFILGCKDTEKTDSVSELEACKIYLDEQDWASAIDSCESAGGDEGYHLAAQAYMGSAGVTIFDLIQNIINDSSNIVNTIFGFVPTTTANKAKLDTALEYLMGTRISQKTQLIYLESILVSSTLIFYELKSVFGLDVSGDSLVICDLDATSGPDACSFTFDVSPDVPPLLTFSGFGTAFHTNLCDSADTTHDGTQLASPTVDYDVTNDSCIMQTGSLLQYHKTAQASFVPSANFQDASGDSVFNVMNFYTLFDTGNVGNVSGDEVPLCKPSVITDVTADDGKIYDCEIFGAMTDPSSSLF